MLISLHQSEIAELRSAYKLDPSPTVQPYWERHQFESTGRYYHCVRGDDGSVIIKSLQESASPSSGTALWL